MGFWDSFKRGLRQGIAEGQPVLPPAEDDEPVLLPVAEDEPVLSVTPTEPAASAGDRLAKAASDLGLNVNLIGEISDAHEAAGPLPDAPPPPYAGRQHRVVDVYGGWMKIVVGDEHFEDTVNSLPFGPMFVTVRLEPNEEYPFSMAAYVDGKQVGYLSPTEWPPTADEPWVGFVRRLDDAGILPRFKAMREIENSGRSIIRMEVPRGAGIHNKLARLAHIVISQAAKPSK